MKYLKTYNESIKDHYSIYDWFEDLKSLIWGKSNPNESDLKECSDKFIGKGYYDKISNLVDKIFNAFKDVDAKDIHYRMYDVFDTLSTYVEKHTYLAVFYGNVEDYDRSSKIKYSGSLGINEDKMESSRIKIIIQILIQILLPTLFIGYPSIPLRVTGEEFYVMDEKYQCANFNIDNYSIKEEYSTNNPDDFVEADERVRSKRTTIIRKSDIDSKRNYDIDKILEMYVPGIYIQIGSMSVKFNIGKLRTEIDDVLLTILPTLNYEEVIYDWESLSDDVDITGYTLKIVLKM